MNSLETIYDTKQPLSVGMVSVMVGKGDFPVYEKPEISMSCGGKLSSAISSTLKSGAKKEISQRGLGKILNNAKIS